MVQALVHNPSAEADEDIARRMVGELRTILASAKFAAAVQVGPTHAASRHSLALTARAKACRPELIDSCARIIASADGSRSSCHRACCIQRHKAVATDTHVAHVDLRRIATPISPL